MAEFALGKRIWSRRDHGHKPATKWLDWNVLSNRLRSYFPQPALEENFVAYEGKGIRLPEKLAEPNANFVQHHREFVFKK